MKIQRVIHLPALRRTVTLGQYIAAVKMAKANPNLTFDCGLTVPWACTGKEIIEQFRRGMHDRINQAIPYTERGLIA